MNDENWLKSSERDIVRRIMGPIIEENQWRIRKNERYCVTAQSI